MKQFTPIGHFELQTSHCPTYIAWLVMDEVRDYLRVEIPEDYAAKLAQRAEAVFAKHPFWQRKFQSANGREYLLTSMRHWFSGVLARERPALFRKLPERFKVGEGLPIQPLLQKRKTRRIPATARKTSHFVHGCELLPV